jgi:thioredoxin 1
MALHFTDQNYDTDVLKSTEPVLVDFYADWCGPCKMMAPVIEELADTFKGKAKIGKINVDENPNTASAYKVMSIPTILIIKDGEVKETFVGVTPKSTLTDKLNAYI